MTDNYLGFSYRGKALGMKSNSNFKGFIENDGNELSFFNTPDFSNEFVVPQFGDRTIYTGNTKNNRTFNLKIQLDKITLTDYRKFLEWLNPDSEGVLIFDYSTNYGYDVKVQSVSDSEFHVITDCTGEQEYYIDLNVEFITVKDFAARWIATDVAWTDSTDPLPTLINNDAGEPFVTVEGNIFTFKNYNNLKNYLIIEFNDSLVIRKTNASGEILVNVTGTGSRTHYSEFGIVVDGNGNFVPCGPKPLISLEPGETKILHLSKTADITIIPTSREIL